MCMKTLVNREAGPLEVMGHVYAPGESFEVGDDTAKRLLMDPHVAVSEGDTDDAGEPAPDEQDNPDTPGEPGEEK